MAKSHLGNEAGRLRHEIEARLRPFDTAVALISCWIARMKKDGSESEKVLAEAGDAAARSRSVPPEAIRHQECLMADD